MTYWELWRQDLRWEGPRDAAYLRPTRASRRSAQARETNLDLEPFENLASSLALSPAVRDALGTLVLRATSDALTSHVDLPTLAREASRTSSEHAEVIAAFAVGSELVRMRLVATIPGRTPAFAATRMLVEMITGGEDRGPPDATLIATSRRAHIGCITEDRVRRCALVIAAVSSNTERPLVHFVGRRGDGRLRVASSIAAFRNVPAMLVVNGAHCHDREFARDRFDDLCVEALRLEAQMIITNVDEIQAAHVARLRFAAHHRELVVWTTSERSLQWSASALTFDLGDRPSEVTAAAWQAEATAHEIEIDPRELGALCATALTREQIRQTVRFASATRSPLGARLLGFATPILEGAV